MNASASDEFAQVPESIFDLEKSTQGVVLQSKEALGDKLKQVLKEVRNDQTDHLEQKLQADAEKEATRTEVDVYREVFIDEANTHLL